MIRFRKDVRPYNCFSNFYPCTVIVDGMRFRSAEAAFQAQKVPLEKRRDFIFCTPSAAKHLGRHVPLPADWDAVRDEAMHKVVYAKFSKNENLRQILLSTEDEELVEDTTGWHDNIWGDCSCPKCQYIKGRNKLGKILMQVRDEIKTGKMQHP